MSYQFCPVFAHILRGVAGMGRRKKVLPFAAIAFTFGNITHG